MSARRCKAVYSYQENNNDELSLSVGDIIEVFGEVKFFLKTLLLCILMSNINSWKMKKWFQRSQK